MFPFLLALVAFVRLYLRVGRLWLGHAAWGVRLLSLIINFSVPTNLNYVEMTGLSHTEFLGQRIAVAEGIRSSWTRVGELSSLLMLVFVLDASIACWRRGDRDDRRKAVTVGGSIVMFILLAADMGRCFTASYRLLIPASCFGTIRPWSRADP
jgi:hypothetical protein